MNNVISLIDTKDIINLQVTKVQAIKILALLNYVDEDDKDLGSVSLFENLYDSLAELQEDDLDVPSVKFLDSYEDENCDILYISFDDLNSLTHDV